LRGGGFLLSACGANQLLRKIGIFLTAVWLCYVTYLFTHAYSSARSFQDNLLGECPTLNIQVVPSWMNSLIFSRREYVNLIAWYDQKTGEEIFISSTETRQYRSFQNCDRNRYIALIKSDSAKAGLISPELRTKYRYFIILLVFPPLILFFTIQIIGFLFKKSR